DDGQNKRPPSNRAPRESWPSQPPHLNRLPQESKNADGKQAALGDVVLDRHANIALPAPRQARGEFENERHDQQRQQRGEKSSDDLVSALRTAELRQQQWDEKQFVKCDQTGDAFVPFD